MADVAILRRTQEWKERGRAQAWKAATSDLDGMDSRLESGFARLLEAGPRPSRAAVEAYKRLQERTQGVADEFHELKTTRTRLVSAMLRVMNCRCHGPCRNG